MRLLSLVLLIFCLIDPATAQVEHGSIGVVYFTQEKIAAAADSRGILAKREIDDSICKIAALGGNIIFVSTGIVRSFGLAPLVPDWDNIEAAREALAKISGQNPKMRPNIAKIANEWIGTMEANFNIMARQKPDLFSQYSPQKPESFTVGLLGGLDADGVLALFQMKIDISDSGKRAEGRFRRVEKCGPYNFCIIGAQDMATEAAQKEVAEWNPTETALVEDYDILRAIRLVELTIKQHTGDDVGGKIDAVQLVRDGSIRWYRRKENCPPK